jgi:hypothetical protein
LATDLTEEKLSLAQVLNKNRTFVMVLLGVPVIGMLIAVAVIFYKKPDNMIVVFGVILFVGVQYILMMFFFMKRIEALAKKEEAERQVESEEISHAPADEEIESEGQLDPEEKRIFPVEEDSS